MLDLKKKVLLLGTERIGHGDDVLGYEILVTLLKALGKRDDGPIAVICWNTAVNLLAEGSPLIPHFKQLEEKGIPILAGKLCVQELELIDKMAVGEMATIDEILDLMLHNSVISL